eukprot:gene9428-10415_t
MEWKHARSEAWSSWLIGIIGSHEWLRFVRDENCGENRISLTLECKGFYVDLALNPRPPQTLFPSLTQPMTLPENETDVTTGPSTTPQWADGISFMSLTAHYTTTSVELNCGRPDLVLGFQATHVAKPKNKIPAEHLILERRRNEELREKSIAETNYNKQCYLKSAWEKSTDRRIQKNIISRKVEAVLHKEKISLEERKDKLREMLLAEEEQQLMEMEAKQETIEERQEKMKLRARELRAKREQERQAMVAEKLDQKFRNECEELRTHFSRQQQDQLFAERKAQLAEKEDDKLKQQKIESLYAELWDQDRIEKARKEEIEEQERMKRNHEMVDVLNLQKSAIERRKEEERQLKQLEAEWLKQEATIRESEDRLLVEERKQKQLHAKKSRDISVKLKQRKEAKERQEQLAMDMKILQKVIEDTQNEEMEDKHRQKILREENQRFMHYVAMARKEDKEREDQINKAVSEEVEQQYARRDAKKEKEKEARHALLQNVLQTREQQIKEREDARKREQEGAMKERQDLLQQIEEYKRLEAEQIEKMRQRNKQYQEDLVEQLKYERKLKDKEIDEARREIESMQHAEKTYQRKLQSALEKPERTRRQHPFRITGIGLRAKSS